MDPLFEPSVLEAVAAQLARAFPEGLPAVPSADPHAVAAAYWRARGQQDVIAHLRAAAAAAQPEE